MFAAVILAVCHAPMSANADLIGFDFGSSFMKATLVIPGKPFGIVENTATQRKTNTMVGLGTENRLFGVDSFNEAGKYPQNTFEQLARTFGQTYDEELIEKFKKERFSRIDFVADERGQVGWKIMREKYGNQEPIEQIITSEETVAMLFQYVRMLAEKQAGGLVRDCVITIPSWFTYDQRLMIKDAAEQFANLNVLQLVHENTAAAVMFGIDQKIEQDQNLTILIYNMGAMDTEVQITRYSMFNITEKKSAPYIHILAETWDKELGSNDLDMVIVNLLADKFNSMKERVGKPDVRENYRAVRRLIKDAVKIKEILSANKKASVKIPELQDYVTLQFDLERTVVEEAAADFFSRVKNPINEALAEAGLTMEDIDQVEILGGGVRTPKTLENMEIALGRKDLSTHLNGDEAMCFGSAFIASNSSSAYKVKHVFLTQNPKYDVHVKISALNETEYMSEEDQKLLGVEDDEIIKYNQEFRLFNTSDYIGKSKGLSLSYDKDMKIELFKQYGTEGEKELIDTFIIDDITKQYEAEIEYLKKDHKRGIEDKKKKAEKAKEDKKKKKDKKKKDEKEDMTDEEIEAAIAQENEEKEEEAAEAKAAEDAELDALKAELEGEEYTPPKPKTRISIEFSRSGFMQISKANVGSMYLSHKQVRKSSQLTEDQLRVGKARLKWYKERDEDKIKTDMAKNEFESMIYKLKDWLREEENWPYIKEDRREQYLVELTEMEDWLYEDGAEQNHTVYQDLAKNLTKDFNSYDGLKQESVNRARILEKTEEALTSYENRLEDIKENKTWISTNETDDVQSKINDIRAWIKNQTEQQDKLESYEKPIFTAEAVVKQIKSLKKLYTKVSSKKKPKVKKEKKVEKEEEEDFDDKENTEDDGSKKEEEKKEESGEKKAEAEGEEDAKKDL